MTDPKPHHFDIRLTQNGSGSVIRMDGAKLRNVRSVKVSAGGDEPTVVILELFATADVEAGADIEEAP